MPQSLTCPVLVLDGGLGTTLQDHFHSAVDSTDGQSRPLWSSHLLISSPPSLQAAQTAFATAGADIILTATYQASFTGFQNTKTIAHPDGVARDEAKAYMRSAVRIARDAFSGRRGKVALGLGAYGAVMVPGQEYSGAYDKERSSVEGLRQWHLERLRVFAEDAKTWEMVDMVAFETLPVPQEVVAVRLAMSDLAAEGGQSKDFWISCVFPGEGEGMVDGTAVEELVERVVGEAEGAAVPFAVGLNCTKMNKVEGLIEKFEQALDARDEAGKLGLVVYPDGTRGEVYNTTTQQWEQKGDTKDTPEWDEILSKIVHASVKRGKWSSIIAGGCCKTGPAEIAALRRRLDE